MYFIKKKKMPIITQMKETYFMYTMEIKKKFYDFIIFQFFECTDFF
jgi:hypothetical protein